MANGDFCHIQFSSTDIEKTRAFYEEIFGWTFEIVPGFDTYAMFRTPNGLGGGVDLGPDAEPPSDQGHILHIEVDDIDATLAKIIEKAGRRSRPR